MTRSTLNVENKIFRQVLKGIGFYEEQQNHSPTMEEVTSFVLLENKNLAPISHVNEKITQSLEKLEELHVCRRLPGNTFSLYNKNPVNQLNELTRKRANQRHTVQFDLTDFTSARTYGLVAQRNVVEMGVINGLQQEVGFVGSSEGNDVPEVETGEEEANEAGPSGESKYGQLNVADVEVVCESEQEVAMVGSSENVNAEGGQENDGQEEPEAGSSEESGEANPDQDEPETQEPIEETIDQVVEQFEQELSDSLPHISHMFT